jgi:hypothetical protein
MKRSLQIAALVAAGALYMIGQTAMAACSGKHCAASKSATSGAGAGKIKGAKPALNPQPLPPGIKRQPTTKQ